jgi:hypothetical protein
MKLAIVDLRQVSCAALSAFGPLLPFAASIVRASREGRWPGARSPAPRSRGTGFGLLELRHQRRVLVCRWITPRMVACARTPSHLPLCVGGMRRRCMPATVAAGRRWCPWAQAPFAVSSTCIRDRVVDGATTAGLIRCPASVGRRTGAPPSPWRQSIGMRNARPTTALSRKKHLHTASTLHASRAAHGALDH